jgi:capsular polysaccharide export protein
MTQFIFHGLDPRKAKRAQIEATLARQAIVWRRGLGLRLRGYPQSRARAREALKCAQELSSSKLAHWFKGKLFELQYNWARAKFETAVKSVPQPVALAWNGLNGSRRVWVDAARDAGAKVLCFEHAPVPNAITADPKGVNFANALPREGQPYLDWIARHPELRGAWHAAAERITQRKPNPAKESLAEDQGVPSLDSKFLFVPLQYQGDSQLRIFGGLCRNLELTINHLINAAQDLPAGWHLRVKEHPSDPFTIRPYLEAKCGALPIYIDNTTDTFAQVRAAKAVITVNSSVGLEALMLGKPVVVMGEAFWGLPGLTITGQSVASLKAALAAPEHLAYDPELREAFLSYLVARYYPRLNKVENGFEMPPEARARVLERLETPLVTED